MNRSTVCPKCGDRKWGTSALCWWCTQKRMPPSAPSYSPLYVEVGPGFVRLGNARYDVPPTGGGWSVQLARALDPAYDPLAPLPDCVNLDARAAGL